MSVLVYETVRHSALADSKSVLMLLHGVGSNERNMASLAAVADDQFTVISVRAPLTMSQGSYAWFPVQFTDRGPILDRLQAEQGRVILANFIEEYKLAHNLQRVFLLGFSQGAIMAALCATTLPEVVAGAVCMSGRFPLEFESSIVSPDRLRQTSLLITHGTEDRTLPVQLGQKMRDLLEDKGVSLEYREYPAGHNVTEEMIVDVRRWLSDRLSELLRVQQ